MPARLVEVERNASVVCQQPQSDYNPWPLLASYRCQANVNRIELRVKVDEGTYGPVVVYVCPKTHPKTVQIRSYEVKPLSSHKLVHSFDNTRPLNTLSFSGNFSLAEAHSWLSLIVPGVPTKPPSSDIVTVNYISNSNAATQLQVTYSKGSITFRSDSMSTIAIIREIISDETTNRTIKVQISCDLNDASIDHCLKLMHPRMTHLLDLEKKRLIAAALRELEANSGDISFLSERNRKILEQHDTIFRDAEKDSIEILQMLYARRAQKSVHKSFYLPKRKFLETSNIESHKHTCPNVQCYGLTSTLDATLEGKIMEAKEILRIRSEINVKEELHDVLRLIT